MVVVVFGVVFIAVDYLTSSVVVAHEGTNPTNILSLLNDAEVDFVPLDSDRFPSAPGA